MTTDQAVAQGPHNHPPRCCCPRIPDTSNPNPGRWIANLDNPCPACTTHGQLARLSAFDGVCGFRHLIAPDQTCTSKPHPPGTPHSWDLPPECPSCHQLQGRPPTDFCLQADWHGQRAVCTDQCRGRQHEHADQCDPVNCGHHHPTPAR